MTKQNAAGIGQNGCLKDFTTCTDSHADCSNGSTGEVNYVIAVVQIKDEDTFGRKVGCIVLYEIYDFIR